MARWKAMDPLRNAPNHRASYGSVSRSSIKPSKFPVTVDNVLVSSAPTECIFAMRLADVILDLAAVASASRSVLSKHVALRARQIDRFSKTSSLTARPRAAAQHSTPESNPNAPSPRGPVSTEAAAQPKVDSKTAEAIPVQEPHRPNAGEDAKKENGAAELGNTRRVAPWATREGLFATPSKAPKKPSFAPPLPTKVEGVDASLGEVLPEDVNVNIFQTARGSRILESLKTDSEKEAGSTAQATQTTQETKLGDRVPTSIKASEARTPLAEAETPAVVTDTTPEEQSTSNPAKAAAERVLEAPDPAASTYQLRESKVPATRLSRIWNYGGLAAGMLGGALTESISRGFGGGSTTGTSAMLSPANMERLVSKLSRMRGAALKMGQMLSFQDAKMLPGPIREVLQRVQDRADYMPAWQRDRVLAANLGPNWRDLFVDFEEKPIAAASIGQVHRATLKPKVDGDPNPIEVAVKIQFPGVADSINSDLDNLAMLLAATKLLPKGLYLDKTIANARTELAWECDYEREAECARRYRELLAGDEDAVFTVPRVFGEASGKQVLTMEFMHGIGVTRGIHSFTQEQRDRIGTHILRLCLREITEFRFMQTDPNWTNFLYNAATGRLELLDFGASREYPERFVSLYVRLLHAASKGDRDGVRVLSEALGYLTGHESRTMLDAHTQSVLTLAEPFLDSAPEVYDFSDQTITERVKSFIPVMIKERLAPPPEETYSLHRKLSGAFLLCARLGSRVRCRDMFVQSVRKSGLVPDA